jgi:mono/diheme cytochrome c family protein
MIRRLITLFAGAAAPLAAAAALPASTDTFLDTHCAGCHNDVDKEANLSLESLTFAPSDPANFQTWTRIYERVAAGEMPPAKKRRPEAAATANFLQAIEASLVQAEATTLAEGRATRRRLNAYEYEHTLRDLLASPWLQIRGLFPEDGEAHRFNKLAEALDVSHVHLARYMNAADHAIRQVVSTQWHRPPTQVKRYYARDQRTLTSKFTQNPFNASPDRQTYPLLGFDPQPAVRAHEAPLSVGDRDPAQRELEAVGWVSSNYVTGFTYRWDQFRAPVSGRYRIRFSGYTMWCAPGGISRRFANDRDTVGSVRPPNKLTPNYDALSRGRRDEPITVYTRNGVLNRRVGEFDLTPEPAIHDLGEVWLVANETLVPDASRFYRSRPNNFRNPLMQEDGCPSVAFRWMEVEGPLTDDSTAAGYRLLFGDLPLRAAKDGKGITVDIVPSGDTRESGRRGGQRVEPTDEKTVEVVSENPTLDAERLIRSFLARVYRRPATETDVARFLALVAERRAAGLSFTEAMVAGYTAILASPRFVFLDEPPGRLDDTALATRLALFLWNSAPDARLLELAAAGRLHHAATLQREVDRLLDDPKSARFVEAFLDYWIDARKVEDTTPSTTLYNDYYLDDALTEAALAETRHFFTTLIRENLSTRNLVSSDFTFLNERLAEHYGIPGVKGIAMRRVSLPPDSPRGGLVTQALVLKVTANGTTTSPVLRGKWINERILGLDVPPPPPVAAVEPDIRGAVTLRQQLEQHRADPSCASCHIRIDPAGFALESFDVFGGWRDRYRAIDEGKPGIKGLGKNGQPFAFHLGPEVDSAGTLPDGRPFRDIREFKQLLVEREPMLARNLAKQLLIYATGAPVRFSDREALTRISESTRPQGYGVRSLVHAIAASELFQTK